LIPVSVPITSQKSLEAKRTTLNGGFSIDFFKMSAFNKIPDVDFTVFATGSNEVGVWCKIQGVDLSLVSNESVL
jgi:hypothetical protein